MLFRSPHMACLSSRPRPQWRTASVPFTPTTPVGPPGCTGCPSCSCLRPWAANRPWHSPSPSAALGPVHHTTQWAFPTACPPTAPECSPIFTSRLLLECPPHSPGPQMYRARPSSVVLRKMMFGEGPALQRCDAKRSSTQCQ